MRRASDYLLPLLIPASILAHLAFAPYTKVEESFNIQATHDILAYGIPLRNVDQHLRQHYDHITFSGAVPRTFLGPLVLAAVSWPWIQLSQVLGVEISRQAIVRAVLGLFNACCLILFRNRVAKTFGRNASNWFVLFQASQFHLMYYASRPLPNTFAFGLTILAARNLLPLAGRSPSSRSSRQRHATALVILTATTIVFRSELAILLASYTIYMFFHPSYRLTMLSIIFSGLVGSIIGLGLSVPLDTFFWRSPTPLWSELAAFKFNILSSKASEWGTSPWHFYFTSSLPRLLFNPIILFLLPFTFTIPIFRPQALDILVPNLFYIAIYSFQPHKEWRFIEYTIPPLLAVASAGASWIWIRKSRNSAYGALALTLLASVLGAFIASAGMCAISALNYPGGEALDRLHLHGNRNDVNGVKTVHLDTLACMTGVTRFGQQAQGAGKEANGSMVWVYDKTEDAEQLNREEFWDGIDYAIMETEAVMPFGRWEVLETIDSFAGLHVTTWRKKHESCARDKVSFDTAKRQVIEMYDDMVGLLTEHVTQGRWIGVRMEPKLMIIQKLGPNIDSKDGGSDTATSEEKEEIGDEEGKYGDAERTKTTVVEVITSAAPHDEL